MRHGFDIDGQVHDVWLARTAGGAYRLEAEGGACPAALEPLGARRFALVVGEERTIVHLVLDGDDVHLHLDGTARVVRFIDAVRRFAGDGSQADEDVAWAPMPGVVVAVRVVSRRQVAAGEPLLVIESMKLETTIRAWRDGEIEAVHVAEGQSFDKGSRLLSLRPREA